MEYKNHEGKTFCVLCGTTEAVTAHDGMGACSRHFSDVFSTCDECNKTILSEEAEMWTTDNSHHIDRTEKRILCQECADTRRNSLNADSRWLQTDWERMESSHAVGIEMECINNTEKDIRTIYQENQKTMCMWAKHHDGSVTGGLELVSSPITLKKFGKFITSCKWMEKSFKVDKTCGLHVHFNMKPWIDFSTTDLDELGEILQKLHYGFMKLESFMYKTQPESRRIGGSQHTFCRTISSVFPELSGVATVRRMSPKMFIQTYFRRHGQINDVLYIPRYKMEERYCWLNLSVISLHDTIEFRIHSGTTSAKKIAMWVSILDKLMTHILDSTMAELDDFGPDSLPGILSEGEMNYLNERIAKFGGRC